MGKPAQLAKLTGIASRFGAFVAERHPFALDEALAAFEAVAPSRDPQDEAGFETMRAAFGRELTRRLQGRHAPPGLAETTPRVAAETRLADANRALLGDCDGFFRRQA